jgi:arylsulfatase A-like enzyme
MNRRWFRLAFLLAILAGRSLAAGRPDIVLIVVESLRVDRLGCYGYRRPTSPCIDRLAASGVLVSNAFAAAPWTMPSVMSLFTGLYPSRHGMTVADARPAADLPCLAEQLRRAGYQTMGVVANPALTRKSGYGRGFEFYDDFTAFMGIDTLSGPVAGAEERTSGVSGVAGTVTRQGLSLLKRRDPSRPLFLFLFYFDPHYDYLPPPPFDALFRDAQRPMPDRFLVLQTRLVSPPERQSLEALYDGEVRYTDGQIGRLVDEIGKTPRPDGTLFVVTADHGEEFWEHGGMGHGYTLYDELLRVPLLFSVAGLPAGLPAGRTVAGPVSLVDVMPTILALAGIEPPSGLQGRSLAAVLRDPALPLPEVPLFAEARLREPLLAARTAGWKAIQPLAADRPAELYDLLADPGEKSNLAPTVALPEALASAIAAFRAAGRRAGTAAAASPTDTKLLRSLGYVR